MKIIALLVAIFALVSSAVALKNEICGFPHAMNGNGVMSCYADIPSWSYKGDSNECIQFTYGGCGGNKNRFHLKDECETMCKE